MQRLLDQLYPPDLLLRPLAERFPEDGYVKQWHRVQRLKLRRDIYAGAFIGSVIVTVAALWLLLT